MCLTTQSELESARQAKLIPLRRWVPEAFNDGEPLTLKPGRYGVDPAPVSAHDGEPLTFGELLRFWGVVWVCCILGGFAWGALIAVLRSAQ